MTLDFNKIPDYVKRQMFLDAAGPVTIQRYDEFAYPGLAKYVENQKGSFWIPKEVTLTKDTIDFKDASKAVRHIYTSNLLRQTMLDSIQGRSPVQVFTPICSVPEIEALVLWWSAFEQIHSDSYSHIIRNVYQMPSDQFNLIHGVPEITSMASNVMKYYDKLHSVNCSLVKIADFKTDIKTNPALEIQLTPAIKYMETQCSEHEHIKAIYLALIASYGLEAIRFMVSFATSLGMVENRLFIGSGNIISLILQDETLHTEWTAWILNKITKDDPRFRQVKEELKAEARDMLISIIDEEKSWAKYLFKEGSVIGLNANVMTTFVDWTAQERLKQIGISYNAGVKSTPLPWFNKHFNTNKKQSALQENESVSYIIGSMQGAINYNELPDL
jgi:ribonucleoside-diphosphate reductase beta chain